MKALEAIVGDISYTPITEDQRKLILNKKFLEKHIDTELIPSVASSLKEKLPLYILSFKVLPPFNTQDNYKILLKRFTEELLKYDENKTCKIYSRAIGKREAQLFKELGFDFKKCDENFNIETSPLTVDNGNLVGCHCLLDDLTNLTSYK